MREPMTAAPRCMHAAPCPIPFCMGGRARHVPATPHARCHTPHTRPARCGPGHKGRVCRGAVLRRATRIPARTPPAQRRRIPPPSVPWSPLTLLPRWRMMMLPALHGWSPYTLTPSRLELESRPFLVEPLPFLCAHSVTSRAGRDADSEGRAAVAANDNDMAGRRWHGARATHCAATPSKQRCEGDVTRTSVLLSCTRPR